MPNGPRERYSVHPKKKKKRVLSRDEHFLQRSFEWLKWKLIRIGDVSFHKPCLGE